MVLARRKHVVSPSRKQDTPLTCAVGRAGFTEHTTHLCRWSGRVHKTSHSPVPLVGQGSQNIPLTCAVGRAGFTQHPTHLCRWSGRVHTTSHSPVPLVGQGLQNFALTRVVGRAGFTQHPTHLCRWSGRVHRSPRSRPNLCPPCSSTWLETRPGRSYRCRRHVALSRLAGRPCSSSPCVGLKDTERRAWQLNVCKPFPSETSSIRSK